MGKVHKFMGLTVGVVVPGMDDAEKQKSYKCDIIYATNNELGFDYLRDNLKTSVDMMVQIRVFYIAEVFYVEKSFRLFRALFGYGYGFILAVDYIIPLRA